MRFASGIIFVAALLTGAFAPCAHGQALSTATKPSADALRCEGAPAANALLQTLVTQYVSRGGEQITLSCRPVGGMAAIEHLADGAVSLAAVDNTAAIPHLKDVPHEFLVLPLAAWSVAVAYNIDGIKGELAMDGQTLARIYLGSITRWSAPEIRELNPALALPDKQIVVIQSSARTGVNLLLTSFLSRVSDEWKKQCGAGQTVLWPTGIKLKGDSVALEIRQREGAIGVVDTTTAQEANLSTALLVNKKGNTVKARLDTIAAAVESADIGRNPRADAIYTDGERAYPLVGVSGIVLRSDWTGFDAHQAYALRQFLRWMFSADQMDITKSFTPLPRPVRDDLLRHVRSSQSPTKRLEK